MLQFEGRWYSVAKLYSRDVDQSGEYLAKRTQNGRVSLKYRGSRCDVIFLSTE